MSERIRQLEDALEISEAARTSAPHPLLREELLAIKRGVDDFKFGTANQVDPEQEADVLNALGTLTISDRGVSRFIGPSGGSEVSLTSVENAFANACLLPLEFIGI